MYWISKNWFQSYGRDFFWKQSIRNSGAIFQNRQETTEERNLPFSKQVISALFYLTFYSISASVYMWALVPRRISRKSSSIVSLLPSKVNLNSVSHFITSHILWKKKMDSNFIYSISAPFYTSELKTSHSITVPVSMCSFITLERPLF